MRCVVALALAWLMTTALIVSAQQVPTFRVGVDAIPLDVLVLDKDRHPVRGLTAADFTILENGKPQPIVSFGEVDIPDPVAPTAPWMRDVGPDVISNDLRARRLVILVLDDAYTGVEHGEPRAVRQVARAVVDQLGPADLAAVVYTWLGRTQNFTADRSQLLAAIESFQPRNINLTGGGPGVPLGCTLRAGGCATMALSRVAEVLRTAPPGRKALIYISPGVPFDFSMANPNASADIQAIREMVQNLQLSNTSVYPFDPQGLTTATSNYLAVNFADGTGGRAIFNTNTPWEHVQEVFHENSSYYLLGYQSTNSIADGAFRKTQVKVNRPGVEVRSRSGYFAVKPEKANNSKKPGPSPLDVALARGLPSGDMPLRVSTAAFAVPGRREADVAIVADVLEFLTAEGAAPPPGGFPGGTRRVSVVATAFDTGWASKGAFKQTVELTLKPTSNAEAEYEVISRLPLAPGRYEVRFAADSAGRVGSVFVDIDVPDFAKDDLSMSGLVVERTPALPIAPKNALSNLIPIVPTTARDFARTDRVTAFLRVYEGGKKPLMPLTLRTSIVDANNRAVFDSATPLSSPRLNDRSADYRFDLPLARLEPGEHLLTIEATLGKRTVRRDMRFRVK